MTSFSRHTVCRRNTFWNPVKYKILTLVSHWIPNIPELKLDLFHPVDANCSIAFVFSWHCRLRLTTDTTDQRDSCRSLWRVWRNCQVNLSYLLQYKVILIDCPIVDSMSADCFKERKLCILRDLSCCSWQIMRYKPSFIDIYARRYWMYSSEL